MTTPDVAHRPAPPAAEAASGRAGAGSLADLVERRAPREEIERHLDALSPALRMEQVLAVRGKGIKRLYEAVRGAPPIALEEIVPPGMTSTIILEGRNSLPTFSRFQKRFARVGGGVIVGYNHQTLGFVTGPGYFVVKPAETTGDLAGEILLDYTEAPPAEPAGWPRYVPNDRGLSRAVFMHMKDYCRRVAKGVLVGKAYKKGVDQNAYFTLTSATE